MAGVHREAALNDWFDTDAESSLEKRLREAVRSSWGNFPPLWVLATDRGDERPLLGRYRDFEAFRGAEPRLPVLVLRVCLDALRAATRWCHEVGSLRAAVTLDDFDEWQSGELPFPFPSLLLVKYPDRPLPIASSLPGQEGQVLSEWLSELEDDYSEIVAVEDEGRVVLYWVPVDK